MFVVETVNSLYGLFKTASAAAKWADEQIPLSKWSVRRVRLK